MFKSRVRSNSCIICSTIVPKVQKHEAVFGVANSEKNNTMIILIIEVGWPSITRAVYHNKFPINHTNAMVIVPFFLEILGNTSPLLGARGRLEILLPECNLYCLTCFSYDIWNSSSFNSKRKWLDCCESPEAR